MDAIKRTATSSAFLWMVLTFLFGWVKAGELYVMGSAMIMSMFICLHMLLRFLEALFAPEPDQRTGE